MDNFLAKLTLARNGWQTFRELSEGAGGLGERFIAAALYKTGGYCGVN